MTDAPNSPLPVAEHSALTQYLSFTLDGQDYAVAIRRVQEIKGWDTITRVPYSPAHMLGVINLRGSIVPVIDLRIRFKLTRISRDATTVVIVVNVPCERGDRTVGMVVDSVADVYDIAARDILPPPPLMGKVEAALIAGMTNRGDKLLIIINVELLIDSSIFGVSEAA